MPELKVLQIFIKLGYEEWMEKEWNVRIISGMSEANLVLVEWNFDKFMRCVNMSLVCMNCAESMNCAYSELLLL